MGRIFKFKPIDNVCTGILFPYLIIAVPVSVGFLADGLARLDILSVILFSVFCILPLAVFILARVLYRYKYVVDGDKLVKYKGKEIVFKIKKQDINRIYIRKCGIKGYFDFIASYGDTAFCTAISLTYDDCDISIPQTYDPFYNLKRESFKLEDDVSLHEYVELISYARALKLCRILNIKPTVVNR